MLYPFSRVIALVGFAATLALSCSDAFAGAPPPPTRLGSGATSADASSGVGGAHFGYNWQQGAAVFGFATDLQATHLATSSNATLIYPAGPGPILPTDTAVTTSLVDWYGTVRGVVGVSNGPWLLYGTAGLAYGHASLYTLYSTAGLSLATSTSATKTGWTAGAGFKYLVLPNVSVGFQYLYVDLGGLSLSGATLPPGSTIAFNSNANNQFHTATVGVSFQFAAGNAAAPWQGAYAGIQGGGAWGNGTNATYTGTNVAVISDARLKRDVTLLARRSDGLGIYAYRYLWSDDVHVGVMAQEVALIHPAAVVRDGLTGYLAVNYGLLNGN
jgi:outer membrane immunogenic protein